MSVNFPPIGQKVVAKVLDSQNPCTIGMQPGDEYELSTHKCGDFCGLFYNSIYGWVQTLQFGGNAPLGSDPNVQIWECPNPQKKLRIELRRFEE